MPTTFADHLRSLSDDALGAFLRRRPDLVVPVPSDLSALASRAQSRVSVARALDGLDEFTLRILDAARLTAGPDGTTSVDAVLSLATAGHATAAPAGGGPAGGGPLAAGIGVAPGAATAGAAGGMTAGSGGKTRAGVRGGTDGKAGNKSGTGTGDKPDNAGGGAAGNPAGTGARVSAATVRLALARLRDLFLLYGPDAALRLSAGVEEACPPYPAGLGRPAAQLDPVAGALCADPARLRRTVLSAPPAARAVLDRLAAGPPVGTVAPGPVLPPGPDTPGSAGVTNALGAADTVGSPNAPGSADTSGARQPAGTTGATGTTSAAQTAGTTSATRTAGTTGATRTAGTADGVGAAGTDPAGNPAAGGNPVRWLVENRLLVSIGHSGSGHGAVELPRELGLLLRRDTGPLGALRPLPPPVGGASRKVRVVDSAGAGQAMEVVRQVEALLDAMAAEPVPILRTGGLGGRDVRRLARAAAVDEQVSPLLLEIAYAAGLVGEADAPGRDRVSRAGPGTHLLPTVGYDAWRTASLARRWAHLAEVWLGMTRQVGLIGQRDERDRPVNALAPEVERAAAPAARCSVLGALHDLPPGTAPSTDALLDLLAWQHPRRAKSREQGAREALAEATLLGVTALGALTSYGRLLLAPEPEAAEQDPLGLRTDGEDVSGAVAAARALDGLLPAPVDHVLVQADLTVVVPGPPEPELAAELDLIAEPESAGGATVYRLTPDSVRKGLDAGYAADDLHGLFRRRSRTPVPQALTYLIDDVARKHGGLRAGPAGAYLRSDDEALLAEVHADRRLAPLALRRLAPTVLITPYQSGRLLSALRDAGYAPVAEDAAGAAVLVRPRARRASARGPAPARVTDPLSPGGLTEPRVLGIVEQLRRGDAAARAARRAPVTVRAANGHGADRVTAVQAHTQALAVLQQAVRDKALVWVGYVDAHGSAASRLVRPVSIGGGYLRAEDERTDMLHTFALHRITAAVLNE